MELKMQEGLDLIGVAVTRIYPDAFWNVYHTRMMVDRPHGRVTIAWVRHYDTPCGLCPVLDNVTLPDRRRVSGHQMMVELELWEERGNELQ